MIEKTTASNNGYTKPLPTVTKEGAPFWESTRLGELATQHCEGCNRQQFPPRRICVHCGGRHLDWKKVSGRGRIYSFTIVFRPPEPTFQPDVPYVVAVIDLEEGGRMMTTIVGCAVTDVCVEMPVTAVFEQVTSSVTLVKFRPTNPIDR